MNMSQPSGPPSVLVVEDDDDLRLVLVESLEASGFAVAQATDAADAIDRLQGYAYDGLVVDLRLPDGDGRRVLDEALDRYPQIRAVVMTGFGGVDDAVSAIRRGAVDFLIKPFRPSQLARVLTSSLDQLQPKAETTSLKAEPGERLRFESVVGQHPSVLQLFATLELIAPMNSTVLIHGESGTGKELVAKTIHHNSSRAGQRFVAFNAAAIPEGLVEAELFGHVKGAFTGAVTGRPGRFELAHKGTLFIDEVASMPLPLQTKLLRALQEREVERVGEAKPIKVDIRVIAATNADLRQLVKAGTFREDLYYRLNVIPVRLPPLRERREDIPLLAHHFLKKACRDNGLPAKTLAQDALRGLMAYDWPGNVRQLENAIEYAAAISGPSRDVGLEVLPADVREKATTSLLPSFTIPDEGLNFTSVVSQLERSLIFACLERTGGNKRQAARLLSLSRTTFIDKLQRLSATPDAA